MTQVMELTQEVQTADWKNEKHVPVIECEDTPPSDEFFPVKVSLGKAVAHPNTTEHHIRWICLYFRPENSKTTYEIARFDFCAHGEAPGGPNEGPVYTHHEATASMKTTQGGTLHALALCNIHGLWQSSKAISVG